MQLFAGMSPGCNMFSTCWFKVWSWIFLAKTSYHNADVYSFQKTNTESKDNNNAIMQLDPPTWSGDMTEGHAELRVLYLDIPLHMLSNPMSLLSSPLGFLSSPMGLLCLMSLLSAYLLHVNSVRRASSSRAFQVISLVWQVRDWWRDRPTTGWWGGGQSML